jgi:hypothetical protein
MDSNAAGQIIRALAAAEPVACIGEDLVCALCDSDRWVPDMDHEPDCPWRQAVEWVAAQEDRRAAREFSPVERHQQLARILERQKRILPPCPDPACTGRSSKGGLCARGWHPLPPEPS